MLIISFLVCFIGGVIQESGARSLQLSVNLSLALSDGDQQHQQQEQLQQFQRALSPNLSAEMLRSCMRETEISMAELSHFRSSIISNEPETVNGIQDQNDEANEKTTDYDGTLPSFEERNEESLQCFAHCLYEKLGFIKDGVIVEPDFFRKYYTVVAREKKPVKECINLESSNSCEISYKMHLCLNKLKTLEAERRIREILQYNDNDYNNGNIASADDAGDDGNNGITADIPDFDNNDTKENEIDKN